MLGGFLDTYQFYIQFYMHLTNKYKKIKELEVLGVPFKIIPTHKELTMEKTWRSFQAPN